jgi:hypothetical protein
LVIVVSERSVVPFSSAKLSISLEDDTDRLSQNDFNQLFVTGLKSEYLNHTAAEA